MSGLVGKRVLADVPGLGEAKRAFGCDEPSSVPCLGLPRNFLAARPVRDSFRSGPSSAAI